MEENQPRRPRHVRGPDGAPLGLADLPAADVVRWTARRKAEVVCAVQGGLLTLAEAAARWGIGLEEYMSWRSGIERRGLDGVKTTRCQAMRA